MLITYKKDTFTYFKKIDSLITKGSVLDYGCNIGSFLESRDKDYDLSLYTGIDVLEEAIEKAKTLYPQAEFIHFNDYNAMYNSKGVKNLNLDLNKSFDNIIAYSVFTHMTSEEMQYRIDNLFNFCNNKLFFSFCDIDDVKTTYFFYQKRIKDFGSCDVISASDKLYLVDNKKAYEPIDDKLLLVFYKKNYLASLFPKYNIQFANPNITSNFQTCAILSKK
jgi:hypothetical protein